MEVIEKFSKEDNILKCAREYGEAQRKVGDHELKHKSRSLPNTAEGRALKAIRRELVGKAELARVRLMEAALKLAYSDEELAAGKNGTYQPR